MNAVDKDAFSHALGQTLGFFGKELDNMQFSFWYSAMGDRNVNTIKNALKEYVKVGRYAPRPAQILELMTTSREHSAASALPPPVEPCKCPPEIASAWMWFIGETSKGSSMSGIFDRKDIPVETQERYLHIVNHEARSANEPDAIPDEYKLAEVWA